MRFATTSLIFLAATLHPKAGVTETPPSGSIAVSECVEKYGPNFEPGVNVTMDQAVLQIAANYTCLAAYQSEHEISRLVASCTLDNLFLGMRTVDFARVDLSCREGRESELVSSYSVVGFCMMKAMEDGRIVSQETALAEQSHCSQVAAEAGANPDYRKELEN